MSLRSCSLVAVVACLATAGPSAAQPFAEVERVPGGAAVEPAEGNGLAEKAAFIAQYDDGRIDVLARNLSADTFEVAMLFEGIGGPDVTLGGVDFCWAQDGADPKIRYEVVIWAPDGAVGSPGTELASFAAVANGVPSSGAFYGTNLNYPLTMSDVYIGVRYNPVVDPDFWWCVDNDGLDGAPAQPAFFRNNEAGFWSSLSTFGSGGLAGYKALMVRASLSTPGVFGDSLLVPAFEVDTTSPNGTTTLFAVRNLTDSGLSLEVDYYEQDGTLQQSDTVNLTARDTETVNIRNVPGLATDGAGIARGYVEIFGPGDPDMTPLFAGDYLQVDAGDDFATGERARRYIELCSRESIRFFDFGSGTRLAVWIDNPRGPSPGVDPVSFTVQVYDEAGNPVGGAQPYWTDQNSLEIEASEFTGLDFGTLKFDFSNSGRGTVFGEYSAAGRFSVGFDSQCENPW